tara:strand:- start:240 stop:1727 length:1488 start_codon:yes stop_codon:yes gene_type:complete
MNQKIRYLSIAAILCFVLLFAQLTRVHLIQRDQLQDNPNNTRSIVREFSKERGSIETTDGFIIAESQEVQNELKFQRLYPFGDLYAHITGYFSFLYGSEGLERTYSDHLSGKNKDTPTNITTTLVHAIQMKVKETLGERNGSVVVLNPSTGEILALWTYPSYDPNPISSANVDIVREDWERLSTIANANDPRLARTYREIYFPGSTFKIITAAAALRNGLATLTEPEFENRTEYIPPLTDVPIQNYAGGSCGGDILEGLRFSCNSTFAELAAEVIGAERMIETAEAFGFNTKIPIDLPVPAISVYPNDFGDKITGIDSSLQVPLLENTPGLAQTGIGQFDVKATPLQMALVAAAIANDGLIMKPYVMQSLLTQNGNVIRTTEPSVWRSALPSDIARSLKMAMINVVANGTATRMFIPQVEIGGKTGTAQIDASRPDDTHGWVIGFAGPEQGPATVAIAVLLESTPEERQLTGGLDAAPIAHTILEETLKLQGILN